MRRSLRLVTALLTAALWTEAAQSQDFAPGWTSIDTSGLPSDSITSIDWPYVGTAQGLAYYDGSGFVTGGSTPANDAIANSPVRFLGGGVVANEEGTFYLFGGPDGFEFESLYEYYAGILGGKMFGDLSGLDESVFDSVQEVLIESRPPYALPVIELVGTDGVWKSLYPPNSTCTGPDDDACYYSPGGRRSGVNDIVTAGDKLWASVPGLPDSFDGGIYEYEWTEYSQILGGFEFEFGEWRRAEGPFQRDRTGLCLENTVDMAYSQGLLYATYTAYGETSTGDQCEEGAFRLASGSGRLAPRRGRMGSYDGSTWTRSGSGSAARLAAAARALFPEGAPVAVAAVGNAAMMAVAPIDGDGGGVAWTTDITDPTGWTAFQAADAGVPLTTNEITALGTVGRSFIVGTADGLAVYTLPELAPSLVAPSAEAAGAPSTPVLAWSPPPGGTASTVQLSLSTDFSAPLQEWTVSAASVAVPEDRPLAPDTRYYWRVRSALAGGGDSPWSSVRSFSTGTSTIVRHNRGRDVVDTDAAGTAYTTDGGTVLSYGGDTWSALSIPEVTAGSSAGLSISAGPAGVVWVGGETTLEIQGPDFYNVFGGGLGRLAGGTWETAVPVPEFGDFEAAGYPSVAAVDADVAWACEEIVEESGDALSNTLVRFTSGAREDLWTDVTSCSALAAVDGTEVWVGTGESLTHVTPSGTTTLSAPFGSTTGAVTALAAADDGSVWIGTDDGAGGGVAAYDPATDTWTSIPWPWSGVAAVGAAGGVVWAGSAEGLVRYEDGAWTLWGTTNGTLPPGGVTALAAVDAETVWAMTSDGAVEFTAPSTLASVALDVSGPEGWHQLAAPLGEATVGALLGPVWTQGFPGADAPQGGPTVLLYDEAAPCDADPATDTPSCSAATGFAPPDSAYATLASGTGLFAYLFEDDDPTADGVQGGFPKALSVTGFVPALPFSFPALSYTDTGSPADDGWNLVGNPLDGPIDWDAPGWTRTDLSTAVYVYDPAAAEYRTWNGAAGTLGGGVLPAGQGFWVKATGPAPALVAPEAAAAPPDAGRTRPAADALELRLTGTTPDGPRGSSVLVVAVDGAEVGPDPFDAYALAPPAAAYVLASASAPGDGRALAITAVPTDALAGGLDLDLAADHRGLTGPTLTWTWSLPEGGGWAATLTDAETGATVDLAAETAYAFEVADRTRRAPAGELQGLLPAPAPTLRTGGGRFVLRVSRAAVAGEGLPTELVVGAPAPNPVRARAHVRYALPAPSDVEVGVYDLLGRRVSHVAAAQPAGYHVAPLDTGALAAGVYVVRVHVVLQGGEPTVVTHKLTVVR